jgi:hypothetical protein
LIYSKYDDFLDKNKQNERSKSNHERQICVLDSVSNVNTSKEVWIESVECIKTGPEEISHINILLLVIQLYWPYSLG